MSKISFNYEETSISEVNKEKEIKLSFSVYRKFIIKTKCKLIRVPLFLDYLRAGVKIGLSIAIDFSLANGKPTE